MEVVKVLIKNNADINAKGSEDVSVYWKCSLCLSLFDCDSRRSLFFKFFSEVFPLTKERGHQSNQFVY